MDIKVNDAEWNALAAADKQKIQEIVGGFFKESRIVADAATPASGVQIQGILGGNPFCKAACTIAESAAVAACAGLGNPIAIAACAAAAHAAGDACRSRC
jgi:hypothetical protein